MSKIEKISSSSVEITDLYLYNELVSIESKKKNTIGKSYTIPYFFSPEIHYLKDPWEYKINSYGFRGLEWTFQKTPAIFGCSCAFGIGVETPVSEILSKELDIDVIPNLGLPGASFVNIIKLFAAFTRLHPVSDAIIMLPGINRVFVPQYDAHSNRWIHQNFILNYPRGNKKFFKKIVEVFSDDVLVSYLSDYVDWANEIAENRDITIHWGSWDSDTVDFLKNKDIDAIEWSVDFDLARDGQHPGVNCHKNLCNIIHKRI